MDGLVISTVMKMDVSEGEAVIAGVDRLKRLGLSPADAIEVAGKTALYVAVSDLLRPVPPKSDGLVTRLADYYGCAEQDILEAFKNEKISYEPTNL